MRKKRITVIVLAVMILAIGSFIAIKTKFEIGSADGQKSDKIVIRVDGWDIEYTISDRKLTVEDFESIELGSSLSEIESKL